MDGTLIFAIKAFTGVACFLVGLVLGSLIAAIWLRLAALWLKLGSIPYLTAFKAAIVSNFIVLTFSFSTGVNHGLSNAILAAFETDGWTRSFNPVFSYSPTYFVYATALGLIVTSAIFRRIIPSSQSDDPLTLSDSFALASLYFALAFACMLMLGLIAYLAVIGLISIIG